MTRGARRLARRVALAVASASAAACVSSAPEVTGRLVDMRGQPAAGAFVAYYYSGHRFSTAHPVTYERPGAIVRTDAAGTYRIPGLVHVRRPLDGPLAPSIELVYVPRLHHAFGPLAGATASQPGLVEIDRARRVVAVADVSGMPHRWLRSIDQLYGLIRFGLGRTKEGRPSYRVPAAVRRELAAALAQEYGAFLAAYGGVRREMEPDDAHVRMLPAAEQERVRQRRRDDVEREPLWGPHVERLWRGRLAELDALLAKE